jgi:hypothetical protein
MIRPGPAHRGQYVRKAGPRCRHITLATRRSGSSGALVGRTPQPSAGRRARAPSSHPQPAAAQITQIAIVEVALMGAMRPFGPITGRRSAHRAATSWDSCRPRAGPNLDLELVVAHVPCMRLVPSTTGPSSILARPTRSSRGGHPHPASHRRGSKPPAKKQATGEDEGGQRRAPPITSASVRSEPPRKNQSSRTAHDRALRSAT